jgi:hypothetical protein
MATSARLRGDRAIRQASAARPVDVSRQKLDPVLRAERAKARLGGARTHRPEGEADPVHYPQMGDLREGKHTRAR